MDTATLVYVKMCHIWMPKMFKNAQNMRFSEILHEHLNSFFVCYFGSRQGFKMKFIFSCVSRKLTKKRIPHGYKKSFIFVIKNNKSFTAMRILRIQQFYVQTNTKQLPSVFLKIYPKITQKMFKNK